MEEKVARFWLKIAKFVATVNKNIFQTPKYLHHNPINWRFLATNCRQKPLKIAKMARNRQIWSHWLEFCLGNCLNYLDKLGALKTTSLPSSSIFSKSYGRVQKNLYCGIYIYVTERSGGRANPVDYSSPDWNRTTSVPKSVPVADLDKVSND